MIEYTLDTILTGDARELLPRVPSGVFQLAFADPPYWVGYDYGGKTDADMSYIEPVWLVQEMMRVAPCALVTPGISNLYEYPKPDWIIAWNKPGSTRRSRTLVGFNIWEPVLVYGRPVKRVFQDALYLPDGVNHTSDGSFHNCPKPERLMSWLVEQFTEPGDAVIDPVCGSGTTCKAAKMLGRKYVGFEIDPEIANQTRIRLSRTQLPLFVNESELRPEQGALFGQNSATEY